LLKLKKEKAAKEAEKRAAFRSKLVAALETEESFNWVREFHSYVLPLIYGMRIHKLVQ